VTITPAVKTALINGLKHSNGLVRWWCIQLMDHLADENYIEPLLDAAHHDPQPKNRRHALHALTCELCKPDRCRLDIDLRPELAAIVVNDVDWSVKTLALQELMQIVGPESVWEWLADLPGIDQAALRAWQQAGQSRRSLSMAIACAKGVSGWRGRMTEKLLTAADQLIQAALTMLVQGDYHAVQAKIHSAQQQLDDATPAEAHSA
jgi:HEAT repeat protein